MSGELGLVNTTPCEGRVKLTVGEFTTSPLRWILAHNANHFSFSWKEWKKEGPGEEEEEEKKERKLKL